MIAMASPSPRARAAMAAVAVAVGVGAVGSALGIGRSVREQVVAAAALQLRAPGLADDLQRAESPVRARLRFARALLTSAVEEAPADDGADAIPRRRRRLAAAERLARSVLSEHPASWEAAAITGAALYLQLSDARDPLLVQEYRRWERPLLFALETAPDRRQPGRYLAAAYLELWPVLSEQKRRLAEELVESAFTDRAAFGRLLDPWLRVAPPETALDPIPDRPWAWSALRSRAGREGDWNAFCEAWRRERRALLQDLQERLGEAEELASGGELARARGELFGIVSAAPTEPGFAPIVDRALRLLPHGPRQSEPSQSARRWLEWALARELTGGPRALSVESLVRLGALVSPGETEDPATAALAAWIELARDRPSRAEEIEAASGGWQPEWAPYHLLAARFHLDRGRPDRAREALERVHPDWRRHPLYLQLAERLGDHRPAPRVASREIGGPLDWSYAGGAAHITFRAPVAADGVGVVLAEVPVRGTALAIRWDGATLECRPLDPGDRRLELSVGIVPGVHEIELEPLTGGQVFAGSVELLPPSRPGRPG